VLHIYIYNISRLRVNIGSVYTIKENGETLVVASKEIGLEVNANKINCMVMSGDQNAEGIHNMKTDERSFEMVEEFNYLGKPLTNQN